MQTSVHLPSSMLHAAGVGHASVTDVLPVAGNEYVEGGKDRG